MTDRRAHWENVYASKGEKRVSCFQEIARRDTQTRLKISTLSQSSFAQRYPRNSA
jgi:hypothetical protein